MARMMEDGQVKCPACGGSGMLVLPNRLGERVAYERTQRGLTLREAADKIGITQPTLSRLERRIGVTSFENAKRAAVFYGLDLNELEW